MVQKKAVIKYDYESFSKDIKSLAGKIKRSGVKFDYIVALARGGLVPGVALSHKLNIKMVCLHWSMRDGKDDNEFNMWIPETIDAGAKVLIVDDIIDSGECLNALLKDWDTTVHKPLGRDNIYIASLIYNKDQSIIPNFYANKISRKKVPEWYEFWWEKM